MTRRRRHRHRTPPAFANARRGCSQGRVEQRRISAAAHAQDAARLAEQGICPGQGHRGACPSHAERVGLAGGAPRPRARDAHLVVVVGRIRRCVFGTPADAAIRSLHRRPSSHSGRADGGSRPARRGAANRAEFCAAALLSSLSVQSSTVSRPPPLVLRRSVRSPPGLRLFAVPCVWAKHVS